MHSLLVGKDLAAGVAAFWSIFQESGRRVGEEAGIVL